MKPKPTWVLVMNANSARILPRIAAPRTPAPPEMTMQSPQRKPWDAHHDRPARSFASTGDGRRSGVEPASDPIEEDTRRFLHEVADVLERKHRAGAFEHLVFVGPDEVLGLWRTIAPGTLQSCTTHEFHKNLVNLPPEDLAQALRTLMSGSSGP